MEIRAVLGRHCRRFNTGRWDYINSVADAMVWDPGFVNPNIDAIGMTYGYMRKLRDRVRRAVNTPIGTAAALCGRAVWSPHSGGSAAGVAAGMRRRRQGASASNSRGRAASGWRTGRWCTSCRPVWEEVGADNQLERKFPPLTYTQEDADGLVLLEPRRAPSGAPATC